MLEKDPHHFKKIQALHEKNERNAASIRADAEAGSDSEEDADDEEGAQNDDSEPSKPIATKATAPKKTGGKKSATTTPAPPTIQGSRAILTKAVEVKSTAVGPRRPHRKVDYGYYSAPSDSEHTEKRKLTPMKTRKPENITKLRETINRHARYCPFVQINKKLHHAHRRIRKLQSRPTNLPELLFDGDSTWTISHGDDNSKGNGNGNGNDNDNDHIEKEETNSEDEDSDSMEAIMIQVPRKRKTQVMAAFEKKTAQVEQLPQLNAEEAGRPSAPPPGNEDKSTAPPRKKAASKAKVTPTKETAHTTKVSTKPVLEESLMDPGHGGQDSPIDAEDKTNKTDDATGGARNQSVTTSKAAESNDETSERSSLSSSEDLEARNKAYLEHQRGHSSAAVTTAEAAKKRKVSEIEPNADAEPVSKTRKIRAD